MRYTDQELTQAVAESYTYGQVCKKLHVKGGGSWAQLKRRVIELGLDTSHFTRKGIGGKRTRTFFICKECGAVIQLGLHDVPRTYCSQTCVEVGRPKAIKAALEDPEIRKRIRDKVTASWKPDKRNRRDAALRDPEVRDRRRKALILASQSPQLRAKRSVNAKARWEKDPSLKERFIAASTLARRQRVLIETSPRKPHISYLSPVKGEVMVRSYWERDFALWLDRQNIAWEYEPCRVVIGGKPYTPDFLVHFPSGPCYVEVHWLTPLRPEDQKVSKMRAAKKLLKHPLVLVDLESMSQVRNQLKNQELSMDIGMREP